MWLDCQNGFQIVFKVTNTKTCCLAGYKNYFDERSEKDQSMRLMSLQQWELELGDGSNTLCWFNEEMGKLSRAVLSADIGVLSCADSISRRIHLQYKDFLRNANDLLPATKSRPYENTGITITSDILEVQWSQNEITGWTH